MARIATRLFLTCTLGLVCACGSGEPPDGQDAGETGSADMSAGVDTGGDADMGIALDMGSGLPLPFDLGVGGEVGCDPDELPEVVSVVAEPEALALGSSESVEVTVEVRCFTPPLTSLLVFGRSPRELVGQAQQMGEQGASITLDASAFAGLEPGLVGFDLTVSSASETLTVARAFTIELVEE